MAQRVKMLAVTPDDLSSVPGTRMIEGENWLPRVVLWNVNILLGSLPHTSKF